MSDKANKTKSDKLESEAVYQWERYSKVWISRTWYNRLDLVFPEYAKVITDNFKLDTGRYSVLGCAETQISNDEFWRKQYARQS